MKRIAALCIFAGAALALATPLAGAAPAPQDVTPTATATATPAARGGGEAAARRGPAPHPTATETHISTPTLIAHLKPEASADGMIHVVFETEKGNIEMALDYQHAPITCDGFLKYVDAGHYTGGTFFRTTSRPPGGRGIVIIQAEITGEGEREGKFPPFVLETTAQTGITHTTTTLSMPRWNEPNSATSGVSIMVGESHSLDNNPARNSLGYATFGHVIGGWDVVEKIHDSPSRGGRGRSGQTDRSLTPPIKILKAYRIMAPQK